MSTLHNHRKARPVSGPTRRAVRLGLLATVGLSAIGVTAGSAQAATAGSTHGIAIADDATHTLANPGHPSSFQDSFTVHQEGAVFDANLNNQATAESAYCSPHAPCRSVSLSFQIVTMAGTNIHLTAGNHSTATNVHCDGCQTLAGAYQFIVSTPSPFMLGATAERQLADIHRKLASLGRSTAPVAEVQQQADALAAQVTAILKAAAATAPKGPGVDALAQTAPQVTVHRVFTQ